jgi:hypothetical protein
MNTEQELLQKLQISKKIMERHNDMGRSSVKESINRNVGVEDFEPINGKYNIPQDYLSEQAVKQQQVQYENTEDKILNSRLPDEIKRLMIEHPIQQPTNNLNSSVLSDELVNKATRLMNVDSKGDYIGENKQQRQIIQNKTNQINVGVEDIRNIVRETVESVLKENGLLTESESKTNDIFKFRVGQHIFEGKLTKVKKITK